MKRIVLFGCAALLAACDTGADRRAYLNSLIGQPEVEVVRQLGVPSRTFAAEGRRFIAYSERRLDYIPASPFFGGYGYGPRYGYGYGGFGFPPEIVDRNCETTFEVANERVQSWSLRGNACG